MAKDNLILVAIVILFVATLPILALVVFTLRAVLLLALIVGPVCAAIAYAVSPGFRHWFKATW